MKLKILMLKKKLEERKAKLEKVNENLEEFKTREAELEETINELDENSTEEEHQVVDGEIEKLEGEKKEKLEEKKNLEDEIEEIEKSMSELEEDTVDEEKEESVDERKEEKKQVEKRGGYMNLSNMNYADMNKRQRVGRILEKDENVEFFRNVTNLYFKREAALAGMSKDTAGLMIPDDVYYEINQRIGDYGSLYNIVRKLNLVGKARIIMNAGTPKMYWTEKCEPLKETTLGELNSVELDNFKLGGYLFLCESFVQDVNENKHHSITIADYIINEFAKAIAEALDEAIYNGKGAAEKQPEGITSAVKTTKKVTSILELLGVIGGIDVSFHEHNAPQGTITVAANRKTLYKWIYPETWGKDSNGKLVYGMGNTLPDGTRIETSNVIPDDEIVVGDFNQYILGIRKDMTFDTNDRLQWIEENIGYKIRGRYDGKVINPKAFARCKFAAPTTSSPSTGA